MLQHDLESMRFSYNWNKGRSIHFQILINKEYSHSHCLKEVVHCKLKNGGVLYLVRSKVLYLQAIQNLCNPFSLSIWLIPSIMVIKTKYPFVQNARIWPKIQNHIHWLHEGVIFHFTQIKHVKVHPFHLQHIL